MMHLGRSHSRRGLASALIGEIAAVIDDMEGFEEVRKLEGMEIGADEHLDELGAFTLPRFSVYAARTRNNSGIVRPSALAVLRLMISSNFVGFSTGSSLGRAPRRILSAKAAARRLISSSRGP